MDSLVLKAIRVLVHGSEYVRQLFPYLQLRNLESFYFFLEVALADLAKMRALNDRLDH